MIRVSLLAIFLSAILMGCGSGDSRGSATANDGSETEEQRAMTTDSTSLANKASRAGAATQSSEGSVPATTISLNKAEETYASERKIIRNADLNLEAEDPEDAQRKITSIAELRGGFVVESQQSSSEVTSATRDIVAMTVRIRADKFGETLADIRNVSSRVVLETVKGQDVTEEFIDIEAQLRAKKALEQQFMEIMKRANTVNDALTVQGQLASVRGEIERIEGRKRFLENQSSLSTIKVRLQTAKVFAQTSAGFGDRLASSFMTGADVAINFVLGLLTVVVAILPFALFIGLPVFLFFRYVWKQYLRPQSVIDLADDELKNA